MMLVAHLITHKQATPVQCGIQGCLYPLIRPASHLYAQSAFTLSQNALQYRKINKCLKGYKGNTHENIY